jgi:hypothetical protein
LGGLRLFIKQAGGWAAVGVRGLWGRAAGCHARLLAWFAPLPPTAVATPPLRAIMVSPFSGRRSTSIVMSTLIEPTTRMGAGPAALRPAAAPAALVTVAATLLTRSRSSAAVNKLGAIWLGGRGVPSMPRPWMLAMAKASLSGAASLHAPICGHDLGLPIGEVLLKVAPSAAGRAVPFLDSRSLGRRRDAGASQLCVLVASVRTLARPHCFRSLVIRVVIHCFLKRGA